jgi:hypothetical protein
MAPIGGIPKKRNSLVRRKRRVTDGSDIWERIKRECNWTSGKRTADSIAQTLKVRLSEVDRGLAWAYEEDFVGFTRYDDTIYWYRTVDKKTIVRREIFGETEACAYCYCAPHHAEGCIHGKEVYKKR